MVDFVDWETGETVLTDEWPQLPPFGMEALMPVAFEVKGRGIWVTPEGEAVDAEVPGAEQKLDLEHRFRYQWAPMSADRACGLVEIFLGRSDLSDDQRRMLGELTNLLRQHASAVYYPGAAPAGPTSGMPICGYLHPGDRSPRLVFMRIGLDARS